MVVLGCPTEKGAQFPILDTFPLTGLYGSKYVASVWTLVLRFTVYMFCVVTKAQLFSHMFPKAEKTDLPLLFSLGLE